MTPVHHLINARQIIRAALPAAQSPAEVESFVKAASHEIDSAAKGRHVNSALRLLDEMRDEAMFQLGVMRGMILTLLPSTDQR